jgi:hypothetical protein
MIFGFRQVAVGCKRDFHFVSPLIIDKWTSVRTCPEGDRQTKSPFKEAMEKLVNDDSLLQVITYYYCIP